MPYIDQQVYDLAVYDLHDKRLGDNLNGILKADGNGNITTATNGVDYSSPLRVTLTGTAPSITSDKTASEINTAYTAGTMIYAVYGNKYLYLKSSSASSVVFTTVDASTSNTITNYTIDDSGNVAISVYSSSTEIDARKFTNPNLLDNPWFTVNQRELTSYSAGYSVDRWVVTSNASINVLSNGIELTTTVNRWGLEQRCVKNLIPHGTKVTFSALIDDGEIVQGSFVWNGSSVNLYPNGSAVGLEINTAPAAYDRWYVCNTVASTHTIHAVKIEIGSVSTLANDAPPDYGTELAKCQRYFVRMSVGTSQYYPVGLCVWANGTTGRFAIYTPATMRTTPTSISFSGNVYVRGNGMSTTVTTFGALSAVANGVLANVVCSSALTADYAYGLVLMSGAYIDLSADL